jgi:hypothetical protein
MRRVRDANLFAIGHQVFAMRSLLPLVVLSIGCGTAAGVPGGDPQSATDIPAPTASTAPATPAPWLQPATRCQPQTFVAPAPGFAVDYQNLALDGASLAFVEGISWDPSTRTGGGDWLTLVDRKDGASRRRLARFDGGLQAFAFDASAFYVAVWGSAKSTGNGTGWLARVDRASGETTTLTTGLSLSWSLAGMDDTLFFSNRTADGMDIELRSTTKAGGTSTMIGAGLQEHEKILADASGVAWIESTGAAEEPRRLVHRTGDVTTELARGNLVRTALARSGDTFYFADDTGVFSVPGAGGAPTRIAVAPRVLEVFADARAVAWLEDASYAGDLAMNDDAVLMAVPSAGGAAAKIAAVTYAHDLVADDAWFYWVDGQSTIQRVCRAF